MQARLYHQQTSILLDKFYDECKKFRCSTKFFSGFLKNMSNKYVNFVAFFIGTVQASTAFCLFDFVVDDEPQAFTSPGWPGMYPDSYYCRWNFTARQGHRVRVDFSHFDTEFCCDYLAVLANDSEVFRIRGNVTITEPIISSGNQLNFIFFSDEGVAHQGFSGTVRRTAEEQNLCAPCGFASTAELSEQSILSPGFPAPYQNDLNCFWNITATQNFVIEIQIVFLEVETCCDVLQIIDGSFNESNYIEKHQDLSENFISATNKVVIRFTSDHTTTGTGFRLTFKEIEFDKRFSSPPAEVDMAATNNSRSCGFDAVASNTPHPLLSPGWPDPYNHNLDCEWTLQARFGFRIRIDFSTFSTENCCDYLAIREEGKEVLRLHGDITFSTPLISHSNQLVLIFHSDDEVTSSGFRFLYIETHEQSEFPFAPCGFDAVATDSNQSLNSPGWPRPYNNNLNCTWTITARHGYRIRIDFLFFVTEQYDYLEAYTGEREVFRIKGNQTKTATFVSFDERVLLRFLSDESGNQRGFQAVFSETNTAPSTQYYAPCGFSATATTSEQNLFSPGWPAVYQNNLDCEWTITSTSKTRILIRFYSFNTELCCDYLDVFEGKSLKLRLAGDITLNEPITSSEDTFTLKFHSDATITDHGFQAVFLVLN